MIDPVRVSLPSGHEMTVERDYATAEDLPVLEGESVWAHGRLRGVTRKGGRRVKPRTAVKKAASRPNDSAGKSASGEPGGVSAEMPKEART